MAPPSVSIAKSKSKATNSTIPVLHDPVLHDSVHVTAISQFDNWDARECAVANVDHWKRHVEKFTTPKAPKIPRLIHQIWIGDREPPCVWLDTWRVEYVQGVGREEGWDYKLWGNEDVEKLDMVNRDLYDIEPMFQAKADLLRLELLYKYGGVYIDADMVSLGKSLDDVVRKTEKSNTGFAITYEPDTKDKPYSVLGNSMIVACKEHPLVAMLIQYIRTIYHHKRPHHGVEWVTGPLAFTKSLVFTGMTFYSPPQELFYPQFHYVPNPLAIDFSCFPNAIAFQFGYTCSGLENWVKENNRCRRAGHCPFHAAKKDYAFGPLLKIPKDGEGKVLKGEDLKVPRVVHQIYFGDENSTPTQWTNTWSHDFVHEHPDWSHKLWHKKSLHFLGGFFATNLYHDPSARKMDRTTLVLLGLELLYKLGGYYIPLSTTYVSAAKGQNGCRFPPKEDISTELKKIGPILAAPPHSPKVLKHIAEIYETSQNTVDKETSENRFVNVNEMGYEDHITSYFSFPASKEFSQQNGISAVAYVVGSGPEPGFGGFNSSEPSVMSWAYQRRIPIARLKSVSEATTRFSDKTLLIITCRDIALWHSLEASLSPLIDRAYNDFPDWQFLTLGVEWDAGYDGYELQNIEHVNWDAQKLCGFVVRSGSLCNEMKDETDPESLKQLLWGADFCRGKQVIAGVEKVAQSQEVSRIFRAKPLVEKIFKKIADHDIPEWDADAVEHHGDLLKATKEGQLFYELSVDQELRVMYRSFNDDGGLNSELKANLQGNSSALIEWAKVYFAHQVIFEANGISTSWM